MSSGTGGGWRLPDKLRIVKPLEGSLTLHHWQRLAVPHLGTALEERSGVAVRGSALMPAVVPVTSGDFAAIDSGLDLPKDVSSTTTKKIVEEVIKEKQDDDMEEGADDSSGAIPKKKRPHHDATSLLTEDTRTQLTLTDSTVLHPDDRSLAQVRMVDSADYSSGPRQPMSSSAYDYHHRHDEDDDTSSLASAGCFDSASVADGYISTRASSRLSSYLASVDDYYWPHQSSLHGSVSDLSVGNYGSLDRRSRHVQRSRRLGGGGLLTFSNNIGLARVLNERNIEGYMSASNLSLNNPDDDSSSVTGSYYYARSEVGAADFGGAVCSLTPSVISTPACAKSFSPTGTPLNSPARTPPGM